MKMSLQELLDTIAKKLDVDTKDLKVNAVFAQLDASVSRGTDSVKMKDLYIENYNNCCSNKGLFVEICLSDFKIFEFVLKDISPRTNNISELMEASCKYNCVGSGFYYFYPFLSLNSSSENIKNYKKFVKRIDVDFDNAEIISCPANLKKEFWTTDEHKKFLADPRFKSLNKSLFKDIACTTQEL